MLDRDMQLGRRAGGISRDGRRIVARYPTARRARREVMVASTCGVRLRQDRRSLDELTRFRLCDRVVDRERERGTGVGRKRSSFV